MHISKTQPKTHLNHAGSRPATCRPSPQQLDEFRRSERSADERWSGDKLGQRMMIGGLTGVGVGGVLAIVANHSLGMTVPGSAFICGCMGAGIGGLIAKMVN